MPTDMAMGPRAIVLFCHQEQALQLHLLAPHAFSAPRRRGQSARIPVSTRTHRHPLCPMRRESSPAARADGSDVVALNVACLDGIALSKLQMRPIGRRQQGYGVDGSFGRARGENPESREFRVWCCAPSRKCVVLHIQGVLGKILVLVERTHLAGRSDDRP